MLGFCSFCVYVVKENLAKKKYIIELVLRRLKSKLKFMRYALGYMTIKLMQCPYSGTDPHQFPPFYGNGQIFQNKYIFNRKNFQVEIWKMVATIFFNCCALDTP